MAAELLAQGDSLFVDEDYAAAVLVYTKAAEVDPQSARAFAARAHAHIKLEDYMPAVEDAARAVHLDPTLAVAYMRQGVALFHLEEYETARDAFLSGSRLAPDTAAFKTWARKCQAELDDEKDPAPPQPRQPAPPAISPSAPTPATAAPTSSPQPDGSEAAAAPSAATAAAAAAAPSASFDAAATAYLPTGVPYGMPAAQEGKYRQDFYQLSNKVTVVVYAKNKPKETVSCSVGTGDRLNLTIVDAEGKEEYCLDVELFGTVKPESLRCEVLRTKIEITMVKANADLSWKELMKPGSVPEAAAVMDPSAVAAAVISHKKSAKEWDKVESELAEQAKKGELDDGDPLNNFFKKIFSQGDEDQQRAMKKSFVESNGTVLSTNWSEVGKKPVDCTPPDGMEVKKYGK